MRATMPEVTQPGRFLGAVPESPGAIDWQPIGVALAQIAIAIVGGLLAHWILFAVLRRVTARTAWTLDEILVAKLRRPSLLILPLLGLQLLMPAIDPLPGAARHLLTLATYGAIIWLLIAVLSGIERHVRDKHDVRVSDNLEARRVHTQVAVLSRSLMVVVVIVGVAAALMTFERVRAIGMTMLASAGLAGLVVGFAARPVLENLIAGLQIALTQPIRLDDVVVIEGEWGRIEEITVTYVVVRIWDERRLIVPFSRIIGQPFQNWTRRTADILGTVFIYTDYTVPVERLREELQRIAASSEQWDGRVCVLQVTDATEHTVQIRALVSAAESGGAWDLRVEVREKLIAFLQREYPESLPRTRIELPASTPTAEATPTEPRDSPEP